LFKELGVLKEVHIWGRENYRKWEIMRSLISVALAWIALLGDRAKQNQSWFSQFLHVDA
jgi:hypothetical protein